MSGTRFTCPAISLEGVTYAPEGKVIFQDLDLTLRNRRVGVLGRNGSGKTTLARLISGLVAPERGRVTIDGADVSRDRKAALSHVGILFQNPDHQIIFPTVEEEIAFGLVQQGHSAKAAQKGVRQVLGQFGKQHWAKAAVHHLSQGQRQLVCLMAVVVMRPRVILLDEPFSGLDIPTTLQLVRILDGLDVALVHITHTPAMVQSYDRVLWLEAGEIVADGPAQQVASAYAKRMAELGAGDDLTDLAS